MVGGAMSPTLEDNDVVLVDRLYSMISSPKRGDIIAFLPRGNSKSHYYIRRILGVPGDTVQIIDKKLYINGEVKDLVSATDISVAGIVEDEVTLGDGEYFVLGDDPDSSEDSRHSGVGMVKRSEILGKAYLIINPRSRFGGIG